MEWVAGCGRRSVAQGDPAFTPGPTETAHTSTILLPFVGQDFFLPQPSSTPRHDVSSVLVPSLCVPYDSYLRSVQLAPWLMSFASLGSTRNVIFEMAPANLPCPDWIFASGSNVQYVSPLPLVSNQSSCCYFVSGAALKLPLP